MINGTTYYFRITAVDNNLNESGYSNEVSATPTAADVPPASPQNLRTTAGDRQITLTWMANSEADFLRYRIYGGTSPNPAAIVDSVEGIANTTKTLTGLNNGTTYYYRLTAVDLALNASGFSNEVSATPSAADLPSASPQNLAATAGVAQITLTWNANAETDFLRYRIYGGTNPNPTAKIDSVEGANNTATTLTNLTVGATYYFRLTAVDQALHASSYSNTVTAKPLADNVAPTLANAVYSEPANLNEVVFTKKNSASLKVDIRQPSNSGHTWEFTCRLNPEDEVLSLTFDGLATVPPAFDIFLTEPESATAYNLRANPRLQFATRNLTEKRFQLVAGTKAYLHEQSLQAELQPSSFELLQNFPNPFNPSTQIIYALPEASHVEVSVYNVRAERVAMLVNERQEMGSHTVVWNAEKVGTGVYFIKMRAGRLERMRKCVFVK